VAVTDLAVAVSPEVNVYLAAWNNGATISCRVLGAEGSPVSDVLNIISVPATSISASWDGNNFIVGWSTQNSVDVIRVSTAGELVDQQPIHIAGPEAHSAKVASRTAETLVSWISGDEYDPNYQVRGARMTAAGVVLDPGGFLIHEAPVDPSVWSTNKVTAVAANETLYLVEWIENYATCGGLIVDRQDVLATAVDPSADPPSIGPVHPVSATAQQDGIAAAVIGQNFWTAWWSQTRADPEMLAARRDVDGTLLDPSGIELGREYVCAEQGRLHSYSVPVVAGGSDVALTSWRHEESLDPYYDLCSVVYQIHNAAGLRVGGGGFGHENVGNLCSMLPVAASDGERFIIAFVGPDPAENPIMRWAGISSSGGLLAGGFVDLGSGEVVRDVASNGNGFLLGWSIPGDGSDVYVGRFDSDFNFLDPAGIPLATGPGDQSLVRLASDGANYLALWNSAGTLRAARVSPQGIVLDPGGFVVVDNPVGGPFDIDWDGSHYLAAWIEIVGNEDVVRIRRIGADASFPDPVPVEVLRRPDNLNTCSVASRSDGLSLIALTTRRPVPGMGARGSSGHGVLYWNPSVLAIGPPDSPAVSRSVRVFPNPFRTGTILMLGEDAGKPGEVRILTPGGRVLQVLPAPDGLTPRIQWDGKDSRGRQLPAGVYLYEVAAGSERKTGKLIRLR
jgi:hypothetical protein